jgi:dTDP-D-glucose 4,6-dehydratase
VFHVEVMKHLREVEQRKRLKWWRNKAWMLHHNTAAAYTSLLIHEFLVKHKTAVIPQPPYSPDLATADFYVCSRG